jgi:integrase
MSNGIYWRETKRGGNFYLDFRFHGQRRRLLYGPSRRGAEAAISKIKAEISENKFLDKKKESPPVPFHDFAIEYVTGCQANWKGGARGRLSNLHHLEQELGAKHLGDITTWQIEKYKAKRKGEVKPVSVNRSLALLKHFLNKAVEWGKLKDNPAKKIKLLKGEIKRTRWLTQGETQALLSHCDQRVKPIVIVALHSGMRAGEIVSLKRDQVDWANGIITLTDTKNWEVRKVPMNESAKTALLSIRDTGPLFFPGGYSRIKRHFGRAVKASKIEDFRFHDLRHCFASNLVMGGVDLNTVRELLGHRSMAMTLRYSHLAPNLKAKAVEVLDRLWSPDFHQGEAMGNVVALK